MQANILATLAVTGSACNLLEARRYHVNEAADCRAIYTPSPQFSSGFWDQHVDAITRISRYTLYVELNEGTQVRTSAKISETLLECS